MRGILQAVLLLLLCGASASAQMICPVRPLPGSPVLNPLDLYSQDGVLTVNLTLQNQKQNDGFMHYCYNYNYQGQIIEAPTLRLNPGDQLILNLTDNIQAPYDRYEEARNTPMQQMHDMPAGSHHAAGPDDDCSGQEMMPGSTNIHFHGLNIAPVCHQDDVIKTIIQSGDPAFQYNIQIPPNDSPGMYWYHPHVHGNTTTQVEGGAAGAIIIEGNLQGTQGLPERVLVIRQQFENPDSWIPGPNELTINFQARRTVAGHQRSARTGGILAGGERHHAIVYDFANPVRNHSAATAIAGHRRHSVAIADLSNYPHGSPGGTGRVHHARSSGGPGRNIPHQRL